MTKSDKVVKKVTKGHKVVKKCNKLVKKKSRNVGN